MYTVSWLGVRVKQGETRAKDMESEFAYNLSFSENKFLSRRFSLSLLSLSLSLLFKLNCTLSRKLSSTWWIFEYSSPNVLGFGNELYQPFLASWITTPKFCPHFFVNNTVNSLSNVCFPCLIERLSYYFSSLFSSWYSCMRNFNL